MSEKEERRERPCLHCLIVELIDEFFAEYPATSGASDNVDTDEADEVIDAIAKTVAELTCQQDAMIRQQLIEHLMREIMHYDAEFRREEAASPTEPHAPRNPVLRGVTLFSETVSGCGLSNSNRQIAVKDRLRCVQPILTFVQR